MAPARHRTVRAAASPCISFLLRSFLKGLVWDRAILRVLGIQIDRKRFSVVQSTGDIGPVAVITLFILPSHGNVRRMR
jgi:hypothetical protein